MVKAAIATTEAMITTEFTATEAAIAAEFTTAEAAISDYKSAVEMPSESVIMEPAETMVMESTDEKSAPVTRIPVIEVVPGADSDEDAVHKIIRAPVAVRRTAIRIVGIKPIIANRRRIVETVVRADSDSHRNLALRINRRHHH